MDAHRAGASDGSPFELAPAGYRVRYRVADGPACMLAVAPCETYVTQDLSVAVRFGGGVLSFELTPLAPLVLESVEVELAHTFAKDERVLLNGYQSWTTTAELAPTGRMRGLDGVPQAVLDRFAIDAIGDYRFTEYGGAGCLHGFTYAVFRRGGRCLLAGSLDEDRGLTLIRTDAKAGVVTLSTECPLGVLEQGRTLMVGEYALLAGAEAEVYDRWFGLSGIAARPVRPLVGYSSWYRHYGDIDETRLSHDLAGAADAFTELGLLPPRDAVLDKPHSSRVTSNDVLSTRVILSGARSAESKDLPRLKHGGLLPLFQIDDGYCRVGDWLDVDAGKFPRGLAPLAGEIRAAGFLPGLWLAPFVCERESRVYAEHPDWLLRDADGSPVRTGPHWSGAYALDTRNPGVRKHVVRALRTVTHEWGFGLLKLDFLYAACLLPHDGMNRGQLMDDALRLLREAAGEEVLLLGCGVPLGPAFGKVDYCRIGCDVGLDWDDKPPMRLLHRERVSTKNSLGNTVSRAPLDGRAFGNDPDVFFLRDDVRISASRRRQLLEADARGGSMLLTSDDMGAWGSAERELFQAALKVLLERKA